MPENWKAAEFQNKAWFPEGMSLTNGSLWTLPTDSDKSLMLFWQEDGKNLSKAAYIENLDQRRGYEFSTQSGSVQIEKLETSEIITYPSLVSSEGRLVIRIQREQDGQTYDDSSASRFQGFLWKHAGRTYLLLASMVQNKNIWGLENDLSPSDRVFEQYIKNEVLPNILGGFIKPADF